MVGLCCRHRGEMAAWLHRLGEAANRSRTPKRSWTAKATRQLLDLSPTYKVDWGLTFRAYSQHKHI